MIIPTDEAVKEYLNKGKDCYGCIHCGACHKCIKGSKYANKDKPQFTEEQFDKFFKDCSDSMVGSVNHEKMKNSARRNGYLIPVKSEEPLIVHNVISWKGKNYLKQIGTGCNACSIHDELCSKLPCQNGEDYVWKLFDDIQITDELACMRKEIGDIYISGSLNKIFILEGVKTIKGEVKALIYVPKNPSEYQLQWVSVAHLRLATIEEIQEYFKEIK